MDIDKACYGYEPAQSQLQELRKRAELREHLLFEAREFWEECPSDFCVQNEDEFSGSFVFGSVNRVVWSIKYGFKCDESYCTRRFIEHYHKLMD